MARPRKVDTEKMIHLVDSYFALEAKGDPVKLKCSLIAAYARDQGLDIAGYDIRRNEKVRVYLDELKESRVEEKGGASVGEISYKTLDVNEFIRKNQRLEQLRRALSELDAYWKSVAMMASGLSKDNRKLKTKIGLLHKITEERDFFETSMKDERREKNQLKKENRYLRKMLKVYLYPAVANEILKDENVLVQVDTKVSEKTMREMTEEKFPVSYSKSVQADRGVMSEAENVLEEMWNGIEG